MAEKGSMAQFFSVIGIGLALAIGISPDIFFQFQKLALELPNSRVCETEADYVGLLYMAEVGSNDVHC